jgi:colicin import membrane protein
MRVVHAAALTAAAMLLASITSAQGLGGAAAREREKRNAAPAKPVKVYTDHEVASTPVDSALDATSEAAPADEGAAAAKGDAQAAAEGGAQAATEGGAQAAAEGGAQAAAEGGAQAAAEGDAQAAADGGASAKAEKDAAEEKAQAEKKAKAEADWRRRMDTARKLEDAYRDVIGKLEADLGDPGTASYGPGRASKINFVEENKQKLAEMQANIAKLEEEARRNGYR